METNQEHFCGNPPGRTQDGNALIYVLIAIVLFAGLSFALSRHNDGDDAGGLSGERAELYATQLISYAAQARQVVEQMEFTGSDIGELDFIPPTDAAFNSAPHIHKVYHPEGGGLTPGRIPDGAAAQGFTRVCGKVVAGSISRL